MGKRLGSIIRARRKELKMTCKELAQRAGVDRSYIGKIENRNLLPAYHILVKLESTLGVGLKDLYSERKDIAPDYLLTTPSGERYAVETKIPSTISSVFGRKGGGKTRLMRDSSGLLYYLKDSISGTYRKEAPQKIAYAIIQEFAPSKAGDKRLQSDLITTIRAFRRAYPALVSHGSKHAR